MMITHPKSLSDVLWGMTRRMKWYTFGVAFILSIILTFALNRQTHEILCELVESKLDQISGPIARELILDEKIIVEQVFQDFKSELQALGAQEDLKLALYNEPSSQVISRSDICSSRGIHSEIRFPIIFSGKTLGRIEGQVSYFSTLGFLIYLIAIFAGLAITFRNLMTQITEKLQKDILQPIYKLSNNEQIQITEKTPLEVIQIQNSIEQLKTTLAAQERYDLALRVAHDIRSPVAALEMISSAFKSDPEESMTIMRSALNRIKLIANQLLESNRLETTQAKNCSPSSYPIVCLIKNVVSEIRTQCNDRTALQIRFNPSENANRLFAAVDEDKFKITLSNLMNNAAEALGNQGVIEINLKELNQEIVIEVIDNGPGIPKNLLPLLGTRGITYNKPEGNGLGIYHAKNYIHSWSGRLEIESEISEGSCFKILLPKVAPPTWFPESFSIHREARWICLDDDTSVHALWKLKAKRLKIHQEPILFSKADELIEAVVSFDLNKSIFFIDYHLEDESITGLELIHKLDLSTKALLVTHASDNSEIQKQCIELKIKMLPKSLIHDLNIILTSSPP
jgi:signal transduction histidine kinase